MMHSSNFRTLDSSEEAEFRQWARENYEPLSKINTVYHPSVQDECTKINIEHSILLAKENETQGQQADDVATNSETSERGTSS